MGWFGSFNDVSRHQIVVVVMLTATNKAVSGGVAAGWPARCTATFPSSATSLRIWATGRTCPRFSAPAPAVLAVRGSSFPAPSAWPNYRCAGVPAEAIL